MSVETPAAAPAAPVVAPPKVDAPAPAATDAAKPAAEVAKPAEPPKPDLTAKFQALAKREKSIVEQEKKIKAELAAKESEIKAKEQKFADLERLVATSEAKDYAGILSKLGISYEDLTKWYVQGGKEATAAQAAAAKEAKALDEKLSAQQKKLEELEAKTKKDEEARIAAEEKRQIEAARAHVSEKVKSDPRFELLTLSNQTGKVYETMAEIVASDPSRGDTPEKANALMIEVAEALEAQVLEEYQAISKAQKLTKKEQAAVASAEARADDKTGAAATGEATKEVPKGLTRQQRREMALASLEGKAPTISTKVEVKPKSRADVIAEIAAKMG